MTDSPGTEIDLVRLRDLLLKQTTSEELRSICFDLGVNHEEVISASDKLQMAVINVITHFNRRGRIVDLTARLKVVYPTDAWSDVFVTSKTVTGSLNVILESDTLSAQATVSRRPGPLRVFLCHASDDKPAVRSLYKDLAVAGLSPWLDEEDLLPGQKWRVEIPKAIQNSDVILVCVSKKSANREGYVKREIEFALDIADKQPDDTTFVIPVRLEECEFPERVGDFHGVNLFDARSMERLMRALQIRAQALGLAAEPAQGEKDEISSLPKQVETKATADPLTIVLPALNFRLELVRVPAGEFLMGSNPAIDEAAEGHEKPQHRVYLGEYFIGRFSVTNAQYRIYAVAKQIHFQMPLGKDEHPVVGVSWDDAMMFCAWLSEASGRVVTLPTEAEWEKAARWDAAKREARIWPWGSTFDQNKANTLENRLLSTSPVGSYSGKDGDSPYGCADMAGNVWEWCADWYVENEYDKRANIVAQNPKGPITGENRVLRGGSYFNDLRYVRCANRRSSPFESDSNVGFRVAVRTDSLTSSR